MHLITLVLAFLLELQHPHKQLLTSLSPSYFLLNFNGIADKGQLGRPIFQFECLLLFAPVQCVTSVLSMELSL